MKQGPTDCVRVVRADALDVVVHDVGRFAIACALARLVQKRVAAHHDVGVINPFRHGVACPLRDLHRDHERHDVLQRARQLEHDHDEA